MLLFGHAGITLGTAVLLDKALPRSRFSRITGNSVDIRVLVIGSLLPDIIDKPIGYLFFRNAVSTGKAFAHTLLFLLICAVVGFYVYKRRGKTGLLAISFGIFTHLIFDQMWRNPQALFWPLLGTTFPRGDATTWIPNMLEALMTDPQVYIPELVGTAILIWFLLTLARRRKVFYFLRYGRVK